MTVLGLAETMLGLDGFTVLEVVETDGELTVTVETTATLAGCPGCGARAEAQDRRPVTYRDPGVFRPAGSFGVEQAAVAVPRR